MNVFRWYETNFPIEFCKLSVLNLAKLLILANLPSSLVRMLAIKRKRMLNQSFLSTNAIHLGHLLIFSDADRNKAYDFIINKFKAKLNSLKANKLNHAGRLTYINSVISSIPIYYMSTILFSKKFMDKITTIIRRFWWAGVQEDNLSTPFHFRSWKDICQPKDKGGLAIRDLPTVNKSLIMHAAWKIATEKDHFLSSILKAKYYPNTSFWLAKQTPTKSPFWSSILQIKECLTQNCTVQIHKGNSSIWSTPWCQI